uniref:Uncharacterized protein n=1 Tax=Avena sativa TaxID=4498 RepID=A0ACD5V5S7_AVESA
MKQKIVIQVSVTCDKSRRKAMTIAAKTTGVISVGITGDGRDMLEVVGNEIDTVALVGCLRKKLDYANILKVEEVKDKDKDKKKEEEEYWKALHCYPGGYYYPHPYPPHSMVVCDEPNHCTIM